METNVKIYGRSFLNGNIICDFFFFYQNRLFFFIATIITLSINIFPIIIRFIVSFNFIFIIMPITINESLMDPMLKLRVVE
jgi:hypothetical protein